MLTVASSTVALALCHRRQDSLGKSGGGGGGRNGSQIKGPGGGEHGGPAGLVVHPQPSGRDRDPREAAGSVNLKNSMSTREAGCCRGPGTPPGSIDPMQSLD